MQTAYGAGAPLPVAFAAGDEGAWTIRSMEIRRGDPLAPAIRLDVTEGDGARGAARGSWTLRGVTSNMRYTTRGEATSMTSKQAGLGRPQAHFAALIPIRKSPAWWAMPQDERRAIYEERSRHTSIGMEYLPAIARRLHHSRDLGEPFDFLTWFEYAPEDEPQFEHLLARLRAREEWEYVDREIDIRLARAGPI
jgi:chlorite dismutase